MDGKKGIYNLSASLIYKILTCVVGLLIPRLFVMSYGSEINGLQSSVTQIFSYISLIEAGVGEATLQSLYGPVSRKDHQKANEVLAATTCYYNKIGIIYFLILAAIALLYPILVPVESVSFLTIFSYILFSGITTGLNFFFQAKVLLVLRAEGDMYINSFMTMGTYLGSTIIKILCIMQGYNIVVIQIGYFAVNLLGTLVYYIVAKRKYSWIDFRVKPDMAAVSQKNSVLVHKIAGIVFQNTDIVILTFVCGLEVVSIYTMYKLVINMVTTVIASFSDSVDFIFGQAYNGDHRDGYGLLIDTFNVFYSAVAFALFTVTNILILPFLNLYTKGMDINYIYPILPFLYIAIEVLQVGREAMMRTITVAGHFQKTLYAAIIEMVINLTVSIGATILFKHMWGDVAGLYGVLLGTIAALLYRTIDINRYANHKILNRSAFKTNQIMITNIVMYLIVVLIMSRVDLQINSYFTFCAIGAILTTVILGFYISVQALLNLKEAKMAILVIHRKYKKIK